VTIVRGYAASPPKHVPRGPVDFISPDRLDLAALVPADSSPTNEWRLVGGKDAPDQIAVSWTRTFAYQHKERGLVIWQQTPRFRWKRVYSLITDSGNDSYPSSVDEVSATSGDVTGDGHPDLLIDAAEYGTGTCGTFTLLGTVGQHLRRLLRVWACGDRVNVQLVPRALLIASRFDKDPATSTMIHCCYRRVRKTLLRWPDGTLRRTVSVAPYRYP
jgi:hypothetical protein